MLNPKAKRTISIFITFLLLGTLGCSNETTIDRATHFLSAGMYQEAIPILQMHIQAEPSDAEAHYLLAKAHLGTFNTMAAQEEFSRARLLSSRFAKKQGEAYFEIGKVLLYRTNGTDMFVALEMLETAARQTPSLAPRVGSQLKEKALSLTSADHEFTRELLQRAVRINPNLSTDEEV